MPETVIKLEYASIYQGDSLVLSEVNFEMNKGDFVYLIGKTGTGKSSFLKTLYGDLELTEGEGSIVGFDLRKLKENDIPFLRRKLGVVFQDFKLLNDRTVNGNLEFVFEGALVQGSGSIMILTNESDEDFVAWLLNSGGSDLSTYRSASYASWITIDPEVGVHKDFSGVNIEVGYQENLGTNEFTFFDNLNVQYEMTTGTYVEEDSLDILISAYVEGE